MRIRADELLVQKGLVRSRSQAADFIKRGKVRIAARLVTKPGQSVYDHNSAELIDTQQYVSRAGEKLASVADKFRLFFQDKIVLDVGSSTGGFTDYALQHRAKKVIAVEVGKDQLHPSLRGHRRIELHEQTDIRDITKLSTTPDIVVIDVSFISLRDVLPHIASLCRPDTQIIAMVKPQFEAGGDIKHKGVIKNERLRRQILKDFEDWAKKQFVIHDKADSQVAGSKGNLERFYLLSKL